jgi:hypothetical protein
MARQEDTCWRCGTQWSTEDVPRTTLHVIAGGAQTEDRHAAPAIAIAVAVHPASDGTADLERWADEGGSVAAEAAARVR